LVKNKKGKAQIILGYTYEIIGVRGGTLGKGRRLKKRKKKIGRKD